MTWVKIDDGFFRNRKIRAAGVNGRELYIASLCWSAGNLSDGFIPSHLLDLLAAEAEVKPSTHQNLVKLGLWIAVDGGWIIHDFLTYNRSKDDVEKERARWRNYKRGLNGSAVESAVEHSKRSAVESTVDSAPSRPDPTRPDPSLKGSTDALTLPQGAAGDGGIIHAALLEACLDLEIRNRATTRDPIEDAGKWKRTMRKRRWAQWGADITHLDATFPTAPPDIIAAAVVTGEKQSLRYYANGQP